ncbi:hypothetical protein [Eisenbergiella sp.]
MKRRYMFAAAVLSLTITAAAGCGNTPAAESSSTASPQAVPAAEATAEDASQQGQDDGEPEKDGANREGAENNGPESTAPESTAPENKEAGNDAAGNSEAENLELIFIGGKVRSVSQASFVLSRTLYEESDGGQGSVVVMPEAGSPAEELVTVRCMDSTVFLRWTIKGGGEDIKEEEAAFSELQDGIGLEAQGYFDGDEFIAEKVIIEVYE